MFNKFNTALVLYFYLVIKTVVSVSQPEITDLQCDCGYANERTSKIIGGTVVTPYKYPWMVTVYVYFSTKSGMCGGALITRQYVLTAAHCMKNIRDEIAWRVFVGIAVHDKKRPDRKIAASEVKIHPDFDNKQPPSNDIALIKLEEAVTITKQVGTLCLPHNVEYERPGSYAIAAGWGKIRPPTLPEGKDVPSSRFLKEIDLKIVRTDGLVIKAAGVNSLSVCYGDSGSPIFTRYANGRYHVIGVTSNGPAYCWGTSNYTRISSFNQWIISEIMDSSPCETASRQITLNETNYL